MTDGGGMSMDFELLLARADDGRPVLETGLSPDAAGSAPRSEEHGGPEDFRHDGEDPNSLPDQRWGLIVPEGKMGDRLLELIAPLQKARAEQQGQKVIVYRAAPGIAAEGASRWWNDVYQAEDIRPADVPRYLMILGDADLISWDLQQRLASDTFIGRLCFPAEAGYEAYVQKVLASEKQAPAPSARALFYTVRDGTAATRVGYTGLMAPALSQTREGREDGSFCAGDVSEIGGGEPVSARDFMAAAASDQPTMLFSISNGCGAPRGGWESWEEQRRMQGSMIFGQKERLTHEDVARGRFLPGGAWFYFACYGAGTPQRSAYHPWLSALRDLGAYGGNVDSVLQSLPGERGRPFACALPQAALANTEGPLVVMGHVDLAWTFSFQDMGAPGRYRTSRFLDIFRSLVEGKRAGAGYFKLQRFFNQASVDLAEMYHQEARVKVRPAPEEEKARRLRKALLWMLRQDLGAYVLMGDPAARLNVNPRGASMRPPVMKAPEPPAVRAPDIGARPAAPAREEAPPAAIAQKTAATEVVAPEAAAERVTAERLEAALFPALGGEALNAIARHFEMTREALDSWVAAYKKAGREGAGSL
jgi:hypothetical protein